MPKMSIMSMASVVRKRTAVIIAICAVLVTSAACSPSRTTNSGSSSLTWGKPSEPIGLDPSMTAGATSWELFNLVYEGLMSLDGNLKPVPRLAESVEQKSPTTYVFRLRHGVRFSNGREMTSDDVVGSLERVIDPKTKSPWAGQLGIRRVSADGSDEVTVDLTAPRPSFLAALAASYPVILPMKELTAGTFRPTKEMLGTGPFKVAGHVENESWTFARNPYYWRPGVPTVDTLNVKIIPDDAARSAALRDGSIDVTTFELPDSIRLLKGQSNIVTQVQPTTDFYRIDVNAATSVLKDDRLRQAVALSVDRTKIRDVALGGIGKPTAASPVAFGSDCAPGGVPFGMPDLARARALVQQAGALGKTVEIITPTLVPTAKSIALVLQQNLQAVGLKSSITSLDIGEVIKKAWDGKSSDFDLIVTWFAGYGDPAMVLNFWNPGGGSFTKSYVRSDATLNGLIDQSLSTPPGAKRSRLLTQTCSRIAEDANIIPLVTKDAIVAYQKDKLSSIKIAPEGYGVPLRYLPEATLKR